MLYIEKVRTYAKTLSIHEAVWQSVQECINEGILAKFLTKYRDEAVRMSIFECDIERELQLIRQDSFDAGFKEGYREGFKKGFREGYREGFKRGFREGYREGFKRGFREGFRKSISLITLLLEDNRYDELERFAQDAALREKLFAEYSIK